MRAEFVLIMIGRVLVVGGVCPNRDRQSSWCGQSLTKPFLVEFTCLVGEVKR